MEQKERKYTWEELQTMVNNLEELIKTLKDDLKRNPELPE